LNPTQFLDLNTNGHYKNVKSSKIAKDGHKRNDLLVTKDENDEESRRKLKKIKRAEYLKKYELSKAPIPCYLCTYSCKWTGQLNRHVKEVHEKTANFHCDKCSRTFTRQSGVNVHINRVHQNPKPKKMNDERRLIMNKPLTSTQCEFSCTKRIQMNRHLKSVHLGIKFECDSCNHVSSRLDAINRHKREVHPTVKQQYWKPFSCQECAYTCARKDALQKHIKDVHTEKREYQCDECLQRFKTKATLNNHVMYVHTAIKSFGCHKCKFMAKTKKVLERHIMAVHDKIKNYKCDQCNFATALKYTLKDHVRKVHDKN
jgi:KRAB domain-containing zinc finger protein